MRGLGAVLALACVLMQPATGQITIAFDRQFHYQFGLMDRQLCLATGLFGTTLDCTTGLLTGHQFDVIVASAHAKPEAWRHVNASNATVYLFNNDAPSRIENAGRFTPKTQLVRTGLQPGRCHRDHLHLSPTNFLGDWLHTGRFADVPPYASRLSGPVLSFVSSHCGIAHRDDLVRRLLDAGFAIHSYGHCHPTEVPADIRDTCQELRLQPSPTSCPEVGFCVRARSDDETHCIQRRYRFCLAVENAIEPGYHTEKLYNALLDGCIPVYSGHATVADYVPSTGALLQIADYEDDLSKLLEHIKRIDSSQQLWDSYHRWKDHIPGWFSPPPFVRELVPCLLCEHALWRLGQAAGVAQHHLAPCRFGRLNTTTAANEVQFSESRPSKNERARTSRTEASSTSPARTNLLAHNDREPSADELARSSRTNFSSVSQTKRG